MPALIVRRRTLGALVLLSTIGLSACAFTSAHTGGYDGPVYDSVKAIGSTSNAVVIGRFSAFNQVDGTRLGTFRIDRSTSSLPTTLTVDTTGENGEHNAHSEKLAKATTGTSYLIFVRRLAKKSRADLQQYGNIYQIEGGANGVFTVTGDTATPLGPGVPMSTASLGPSGAHTYSVEDLMSLKVNG
ncbi:hypothetical protein [Acidipropionibacterium virtanenii]|uniref:Lipoprotein n=1 Tax=Acidipropionibacterium virtanenii TaxID=2057246 RepID=A0A344UT20_9ACTN|nr:hypothetical protein [Acidipropionibacterium virtanenii]AXE38418.1 hypothetical protein JS278_01242 [Acidipropionibacterium virtanenii]